MLSVRNFSVIYHQKSSQEFHSIRQFFENSRHKSSIQQFTALKNLEIEIKPSQIISLVGPSGSGKSTFLKAITKTLPNNAIIKGHIECAPWGFIPQNPHASLNPRWTMKKHIEEFFKLKKQSLTTLPDFLKRHLSKFNLKEIDIEKYPFELSGGMKQRFLIILSLIGSPKFIIADEPTASLDIDNKTEILDYIEILKKENGLSVLIVTHDIQTVLPISDEIIFLEKGEVVDKKRKEELHPLSLTPFTENTLSYKMIDALIGIQKKWPSLKTIQPLLHLKNIHANGYFDNIEFKIHEGERLGLSGPSGQGKTTLMRYLAKAPVHIKISSERVLSKGNENLSNLKTCNSDNSIFFALNSKKSQDHLKIHYLYQDYVGSLNPQLTIQEILEEAKVLSGSEINLEEILSWVYLPIDILIKTPREVSGGQNQRICLARALLSNPDILILDELTSSLDIITQNQILQLLVELQQKKMFSIIFLSHDQKLLSTFCDSHYELNSGSLKNLSI